MQISSMIDISLLLGEYCIYVRCSNEDFLALEAIDASFYQCFYESILISIDICKLVQKHSCPIHSQILFFNNR